MVSRQESWAVVGGGMLGLTLALRLAQKGRAVTIFEASAHLGGRWSSATFTLPQAHGPSPKTLSWSKTPYAIMAADAHVIALLKDLGLGDGLNWAPSSIELRHGVDSYAVDHAFDLARLPFLGVSERARLGLGIFVASHREDGRTLQRVSIEDWLSRLSSPRAREQFWHPILKAKLGDGYGAASAAVLWEQLGRQRASRSLALGQGALGTLAGTATALVERFERTLAAAGASFRKAALVKNIQRASRGLIVETATRRDMFDNVVVTLPCAELADLARDLSSAERESYRRIRFQSRIMPMILLRKPIAAPTETFFIDDAQPFPLIINGTAPGGNGDIDGHGLLYMPRVLSPGHAMFEHSDATLRDLAVSQLRATFPEISDADILGFRVDRIRSALPLPEPGYADRLPRMVTSVPGLNVVNAAHVLNGATDLNSVVGLANRAISVLLPHEVDTADGGSVGVPVLSTVPPKDTMQDAAE